MSRGRKVSGIEFGFIIFQSFAAMMLFGILMTYVMARLSFEGSEDYLPVDITYTKSEMRVDNYETYSDTYYVNTYCYVVNGKEYTKTANTDIAIEPGTKEQRYYCPTDPERLSKYRSVKEMYPIPWTVIVFFVLFQIPAIFFLVKIINKKREMKTEHAAYEEKIRKDMQKNRDLYKSLGFQLNEAALFSTLEPMRQRIDKNQKALDRIEKRKIAIVNGNVVLLIAYVLVAVIDNIRRNKIEEQLATDLRSFYIDYKRNIGEPVLDQLLEGVCYKPGQGFSVEEVKSFGVYRNSFYNYQSEDYIEGVYKGVGYRQADVRRERQRNESKLSSMTEGLTGRISVYDFKKNLEGDIVIRSKNNSDGVISNLTKVDMENVAFNEKFEVYAKSAHMVFYLLTPQFMEYLLKLDLGGRMVLRFTGNQVIVLRNCITGIFEPDLKQPLDIPYEIGKSYQELKDILDFIDILNLDQMAEEANARAAYGESAPYSVASDAVKEPAYGVVDEEDSIFGGPDFLEPDIEDDGFHTDNEELENWNQPVSSVQSKSGLKLRL